MAKSLGQGWYKLWRAKEAAAFVETSASQGKICLGYVSVSFGRGDTWALTGVCEPDILSRYFRMRGYNVLHPMGWDAFGLPAENYYYKIHPEVAVKRNIKNFKRQLNEPGFSYIGAVK